MNSILMSIRPQHLCNILNGKKTIELRKKFPKDYRGWVYGYCTKGTPFLFQSFPSGYEIQYYKSWHITHDNGDSECFSIGDEETLNGKVPCRFWVDNVDVYGHFDEPDELEEIYDERTGETYFQEPPLRGKGIYITSGELEKTCLTYQEVLNYAKEKNIYGIHITKLEVFDKPKELGEFKHWVETTVYSGMDCPPYVDDVLRPITRAFQSWGYCVYESELADMNAIADTNKLADNLKTMERLKKESEGK